MRNQAVRKVIVYAMVGLMLLSSLMMGLSFVI
ncbi:stressosome-associated protein Prli42 [Planococcus sp. ISL-109]|uniref:Stressosome-associated protein Prli42 n=1 Tax=Planococcus dechangensis TaxID=1176255 RepID=A0ABV9MBP0_9BACL|nr:stressosome-associated protein Prli42 [Planococcus sp. ISL-109]MBT2582255.1 stressosome-associated protein Prli42 [Planococcus sp. ISL-109]